MSFHNADGEIGDTPYREKVTLSPFGPVDNGHQQLFGLDYRMAAWRGDEEDPFHTEVGYWLWDVAREVIYRCVMVPRGTVVLQNPHVDEHASTTNFEITITVGDDTWSYNETMDVYISRLGEKMQHTDGNTLTRVAE